MSVVGADLNVFIAGVPKCGTTSLADWLIGTGLARLRVDGEKEPRTYMFEDVDEASGLIPPGVVLDASVSYSLSPRAIARMPGRNTHIILCLRNHFERCYSAYSFLWVWAGRGAPARELLNRFPSGLMRPSNPDVSEDDRWFTVMRHNWLRLYPAEDAEIIGGYISEQADLICRQSFQERIEYEVGFFLSRRSLPFFSVLGGAFYFHPLRNLLRKFHPQRITLVTVDQLSSEEVRRDFVRKVFGHAVSDGPLPPPREGVNSTQGLSGVGERPDFSAPEWDFLRGCFRQDWEHFLRLAEEKGVSMRFVSDRQMQKYLNAGQPV